MGLYEDITEKKREDDLLNRLYSLTVDNAISLEEKISEVLRLGSSYFSLDLGVVSKIEDNCYKIFHCEPKKRLSGGCYMLSNTWCSEVFDRSGVKAWHSADIDKASKYTLEVSKERVNQVFADDCKKHVQEIDREVGLNI